MTTFLTILGYIVLGICCTALLVWVILKVAPNKKAKTEKKDEPNPSTTTVTKTGDEPSPANHSENGNSDKPVADKGNEEPSKEMPEEKTSKDSGESSLAKKNAIELAKLTNPHITSKIKANNQEIGKLEVKISTQLIIKEGAEAGLPALEEKLIAAKTRENNAEIAYSVAEKQVEAAKAELQLAEAKARELPANADPKEKEAAQKAIEAAERAVDEAEKVAQEAKYAYKENRTETDPKDPQKTKIFLCAKAVTLAADEEFGAAISKAEFAQDEIDRLNGKIQRLKKENEELEAELVKKATEV